MAAPFLLLLAAAATASGPLVRPSAEGTATVRILTPALIGAGLPAPRENMVARDTWVALPNGQSAPIKLYEFE